MLFLWQGRLYRQAPGVTRRQPLFSSSVNTTNYPSAYGWALSPYRKVTTVGRREKTRAPELDQTHLRLCELLIHANATTAHF